MSDTNEVSGPTARLSLTDIENGIKIIDYAANEGIFRGWEMIQQVLTVRERYTAFLDAAKAYEAANAPADETQTEAAPAAQA